MPKRGASWKREDDKYAVGCQRMKRGASAEGTSAAKGLRARRRIRARSTSGSGLSGESEIIDKKGAEKIRYGRRARRRGGVAGCG